MSQTATGTWDGPAPTTPKGNTEVASIIDAAFKDLNRRYGLTIRSPSPGLTPTQRKLKSKKDSSGSYGRRDEIWRLLQYAYFQKKLDVALYDVESRLHAVMDEWTPRSEKATTPRQRMELEIEIRSTLVRLKDDVLKMPKLQLPGLAEADKGNRSSRPQAPFNVGDDLDRVQARRRDTSRYELRSRASPREDVPQESRTDSRRSLTGKDSRVSFPSSIFTQGPGDDNMTQTTVDNGNSFALADHISMDLWSPGGSYPISSSKDAALTESFSHAVDSPGTPSRTRAAREHREVKYPTLPNTDETMEGFPAANTSAPRLENVFPVFPAWLRSAPFVVAWEITRVFQYSKVDMNSVNLKYKPEWSTCDLDSLVRGLHQLDVLRGKPFPERSNAKAFRAGLEQGFRTADGKGVSFSAELEFHQDLKGVAKGKRKTTTQLFSVTLKPLKLEQGSRLTRHFGSDRFLQLSVPDVKERNLPKGVRDEVGGLPDAILEWIIKERHMIAGRQWAAFFTKDGTRGKKKTVDTKPERRDLIFLFAESSHDSFRTSKQENNMPVEKMLDWLLHFDANPNQAFLKLYSRISIGLSTSYPTIVFRPCQIRYRDDILSPSNMVMNDGIGKMSRSVAGKIRDFLDLSDIPSAVQGRIGSAKGVWLLDVTDNGTEDWIEIYQSQNKWKGDVSLEDDQRTLEMVSHSKGLSEASLNLQFLPVFEDRAVSQSELQRVLAKKVEDGLDRDFEAQRQSLESPVQFIDWLTANFPVRTDRLLQDGHVPFLAGLPRGKLEVLLFLLNAGFEPKKQRYIQEKVFEMQRWKCELLQNRFNIRVGCSTYALMVVDFWGILEEGEVHFGFSSKFETEDFSDTLLHGMDVLVARSPAHFASDVQRVKAVFKPELRALKDCIVFSLKGDGPLADKLSGGDYDGDMAWVCWDQAIVQNFENAHVPKQPDLSKYMRKDNTTYGDLGVGVQATKEMIHRGLRFNLKGSLLGMATNYKEAYCYHAKQGASSKPAVMLSTLLGCLVDQPKQGIVFGMAEWDAFRRDLVKQFPVESNRGRGARDKGAPRGVSLWLEPPAYKNDNWNGKGPKTHIADILKFDVAKPAIANFLRSVNEALQPGESSHGAIFYDADLTRYASDLEKLSVSSKSAKAILDKLREDIDAVQQQWAKAMAPYAAQKGGITSSPTLSEPAQFSETIRPIYESWSQIQPPGQISTIAGFLLSLSEDQEDSQWALLRASVAFQRYVDRKPSFVWNMAGRQLAAMKASMVAPRQHGAPVTLVPDMYAASLVDHKYVRQLVAARKEKASDYMAMQLGFDEDDLDDDVDFRPLVSAIEHMALHDDERV